MEEIETDGRGASGFQISDILAIVQMQWRIVVGVVVTSLVLALVHGLFATRLYRSTAVVHLSAVTGQEFKVDRVVDMDQYNRWNKQIFVQTQLEVLNSRSLMLKVLDRYRELGQNDLPEGEAGVRAMLDMLDATPRQGTELLDISITSTDPERSALLANIVSEVFRQSNLDALRDSAREAKVWLDNRIAEYGERIDGASRDLIAFQGQNDLADVQEQLSSVSTHMDTLNQAHAAIVTERVLLETTVQAHERMLKAERFEDLAKDMNTTLVASLTQDYARAVTENARIASRYGEKMQERRSSDATLARIEAELRSEVERTLAAERSQLSTLRAKEASLTNEVSRGKASLLGVQSGREQYDRLRIELDRAKEHYVRLNQRHDELDLQSETQLNNIRIVDQARPNARPVEPNVPVNLLVALVGGLVMGVGAGFLREYIDDTITSPLEVQTYLKVPFLGLIPKISEVEDEKELALYTHKNPRSTVAETLRGIRTTIDLDPSGVSPRRLLITSAVSAEGKTSTVVRIGVAFANLDKRVLLIDGDLRRPRLHKIFGDERIVGFTNLIHGNLPIEEAIRPTGVENLSYLPSGRGGERPNELLSSPAVTRLLDELEKRFDLIIIDSPPSVLLSDSRVLSRYVDCVVVVVREHRTSRMLIREAIKGLEQVGGRVLGVVVNAVDMNRRRTSYKYAYGYGYGYGYSYKYDKYYTDVAHDDEDESSPAEP